MKPQDGDVADADGFDAKKSAARLIHAAENGDQSAVHELFEILHDELRRTAQEMMAQQHRPHTLQPTALVNEVFAKLAVGQNQHYNSRTHFLAAAAMAMRHILVDHARRKRAGKRDGNRVELELDELVDSYAESTLDLEAFDGALRGLASRDETMARAVDLRVFGGLPLSEIAVMLEMSARTFSRRWRTTRSSLHARLT